MLEPARLVPKAGPHERKVAVVRRDPLHRPQQARRRLAEVVVRRERRRDDALAVPEMEELVRAEGEEVVVEILGAALDDQRRRGFVLDAVPPRAEVAEELVVVERQSAEERRVRANDAAQRLEVLLEVAVAADDE